MGDLGYDYSGCHVVVTGGTRGPGLEIARRFHRFGATVTVTGRQYLTSFYDADLTTFGYVQLELTNPDSIIDAAQRIGPVDVLVGAAAPPPPQGTPDEQEFVVQATRLGLVGPLQLATRLRSRLGQSQIPGGGSVVHAPGTIGWFELTHPGSASEEFERVTAHLGRTWSRHGVRVNAIVAPFSVPAQDRGMRVQIAPHSAPLVTRLEAPRARTQSGLADVTVFLASRGAASLSGQTLTIR